MPALTLPILAKPFVSLGRSTTSDLRINEPTVSGNHAGLLLYAGSWYVVDRGSTNGTFVNECRVPEVALVHPGDLLGLGLVTYRLVAPRQRLSPRDRMLRALGLRHLRESSVHGRAQ
jgi:pSer/pThr/pTyr-binding forkhead associated (FHA) protein